MELGGGKIFFVLALGTIGASYSSDYIDVKRGIYCILAGGVQNTLYCGHSWLAASRYLRKYFHQGCLILQLKELV